MANKIMATPAARRAADARGIHLKNITGTGVGGYVQLTDVLACKKQKATPLAKNYALFYGINIEGLTCAGKLIKKADILQIQDKEPITIPVTGMRAVIAKRMQESLRTVPQYTNHASIDVYALKKFLAGYAQISIQENGIKPTVTDLLIKAAALALREHMILNSTFGETEITIHKDINIGIAVALENGLIVPNIKGADKKTLIEITSERKRLVEKARAGKLLPEEYSGGTFTISNMGGYPVEYFTPIINIPESAILGIGMIADKVVPFEGGIAVRPMMGISLTSDHRHIDGAASGEFIKQFKAIIESPEIMGTER
jgi:pyruvate dehydrogenase E2 component (dihydrolipoamide acetyltransferase)